MNSNKIMLKGVVLMALMQSLVEQGKRPTPDQTRVVMAFNEELEAAEKAGLLDRPIDEVYVGLLEAIDGIVEFPLVALP